MRLIRSEGVTSPLLTTGFGPIAAELLRACTIQRIKILDRPSGNFDTAQHLANGYESSYECYLHKSYDSDGSSFAGLGACIQWVQHRGSQGR